MPTSDPAAPLSSPTAALATSSSPPSGRNLFRFGSNNNNNNNMSAASPAAAAAAPAAASTAATASAATGSGPSAASRLRSVTSFFRSSSDGSNRSGRHRVGSSNWWRTRVFILVAIGISVGAIAGIYLLTLRSRDVLNCWDSAGLLLNNVGGGSSTQDSSDCSNVRSAASKFGFNALPGTSSSDCCIPNNSLSVGNATFTTTCCQGAVVEVVVTAPPIALPTIPQELLSIQYLTTLSLKAGAIFGADILQSLYTSVKPLARLTKFRLTGSSSNNTRTISGALPSTSDLTNVLILDVSHNDLSGPLPSDYADAFLLVNVSSNPKISGPLPKSKQSSLGNWVLTPYCDFNSTNLCLDSTTRFQPICYSVAGSGLPTCGSSGLPNATAPPLDINPASLNYVLYTTQLVDVSKFTLLTGIFGRKSCHSREILNFVDVHSFCSHFNNCHRLRPRRTILLYEAVPREIRSIHGNQLQRL
ncbi:hypothetical protein DFJ73DRAFT_205102 [Zopfochytrium polystomum]|nr:hypothetical protein DFJ73DRAFT_205102 [Zopfochytrium polystomum]